MGLRKVASRDGSEQRAAKGLHPAVRAALQRSTLRRRVGVGGGRVALDHLLLGGCAGRCAGACRSNGARARFGRGPIGIDAAEYDPISAHASSSSIASSGGSVVLRIIRYLPAHRRRLGAVRRRLAATPFGLVRVGGAARARHVADGEGSQARRHPARRVSVGCERSTSAPIGAERPWRVLGWLLWLLCDWPKQRRRL